MNKLLSILLVLIVSSNLIQADELPEKNWYVGLSHGKIFTENGDTGFNEPMANIVGGDTTRSELEVGWYIENDKYGGENDARLYVYGYAWLCGEEKWNEMGIGIGTKVQSKQMFKVLRLNLSAGAGYGWQDNEGEDLHVDTDSNMINHTMSTTRDGGYQATFLETTTVIEMFLGVGLTYTPTEKVAISAGYKYLHGYYNFSYLVENGAIGTKLSGVVQSRHYLAISVDYPF